MTSSQAAITEGGLAFRVEQVLEDAADGQFAPVPLMTASPAWRAESIRVYEAGEPLMTRARATYVAVSIAFLDVVGGLPDVLAEDELLFDRTAKTPLASSASCAGP